MAEPVAILDSSSEVAAVLGRRRLRWRSDLTDLFLRLPGQGQLYFLAWAETLAPRARMALMRPHQGLAAALVARPLSYTTRPKHGMWHDG